MSMAELAEGDGGGNEVGCVKWEGPGPCRRQLSSSLQGGARATIA